MIYGYARCSTDESRQDVARQTRELKLMGATDDSIFFEYESGAKTDRTQFNRMLSCLKHGDTVATTEVSRLTRSTKQLCEVIELAQEKRLKLVMGTFIVDCTKELDPMTNGMLMMMGVFAQMERDMISQRVKSGMANAIAKGKAVGRPKTTIDSLPSPFIKHYPKFKDKQINVTEFSRMCGLSRQSIYKYVKVFEGKQPNKLNA